MLETIQSTILPRIIFMTVLIVVVVATGIWSALKTNTFSWKKVADFLKTLVFEKLIVWLLFEGLALFATPLTIPDASGYSVTFLVTFALGLYTTAVISMLGQTMTNLSEIGIMVEFTKNFK